MNTVGTFFDLIRSDGRTHMEAAVVSDPQIKIRDSVVRLVRGDITELEVDAFVFYAAA